MFKTIEKEYKKKLFETKFNIFYWTVALILATISSIFKIQKYVLYIFLIISIFIFFIYDYYVTMKKIKIRGKKNIAKKVKIYINEKNNSQINNLIFLLKKYNFKTKNDLKLAIDHYNTEKPLKIKSDYLGWIVSTALTISSFLEVAYNTETQAIDFTKITVLASSTLGIIIRVLIPILMINLIIKSIFIPKERIFSDLSEDISYIYLNFDKYKNQLNKKS